MRWSLVILAGLFVALGATLLLSVSALAGSPPAPPISGLGSLTPIDLSVIGPGKAREVGLLGRCQIEDQNRSVWILAAGQTAANDWIIRVADSGLVTHYPIQHSRLDLVQSPQCLARGADGNIWYPVSGRGPNSAIGLVRFDVNSHQEEFRPIDLKWPVAIAATSKSIWLAEENAPRLDRIDVPDAGKPIPPAQVFSRQPGIQAVGIYGIGQGPTIAAMSDDSIWTTGVTTGSNAQASITELDRDGNPLQQLQPIRAGVYLVVPGPEGRLWFAYGGAGSAIGELRPEPHLPWSATHWTVRYVSWLNHNTFAPGSLAAAADGRLWWADFQQSRYGIVDMTGGDRHKAWLAPAPITSTIGAGPGTDVSFLAGHTLYRVNTGLRPPGIMLGLVPPATAFDDLGQVVARGALAALTALFVTFPAHIFNLTFQEHYSSIVGWLRRRLGLVGKATHRLRDARGRFRAAGPVRRRMLELVPFALVLTGGALLGTLLDPHAAWDLTTAATFTAVLIAISAGILTAGAISLAYLKVISGRTDPHLRALPLGIGIAALTVTISRLVMMSPGYLYGVVAGVSFEPRLDEEHETRLSAISLGGVIGVSILSWFGFQWIRPQPGGVDDISFWTAVSATIPAALCLAGMTGSAIELLPVGFLPGWRIFRRQPVVWAILFTIALFLLASATRVTPSNLGVAAILFVIFGIASVVFRALVVWTWRTRPRGRKGRLRGFIRDFFALHPRGRAQVVVGVGEIGPEEIEIEALPHDQET